MKKCIFSCVVMLFAISIQAQIIHIPADYPTIQQGIAAANQGDTVLVSPGTYVEGISFSGKNLTVASLWLTTGDTSYISQTIIDGNFSQRVVTIENGEDSTALLAGFTLMNGSSDYGGGIYCFNSEPGLQHLMIRNNHVYSYWGSTGLGGGICLFNSNALINDVVICNNSAGSNGGGIYCQSSGPELRNVAVRNNLATGAGGWWSSMTSGKGGGIYCDASNPVMENVTISGNNASGLVTGNSYYPGTGGGMYCTASVPVFDSLYTCNVYLNQADIGNDLFSDTALVVIADTFTVAYPTDYHARPAGNFTFSIFTGILDQFDADLFVSPDGNDSGTGLTPSDPLRTIRHAFSVLIADSLYGNTVRLLDGTYSPSANGESFPLFVPGYFSVTGISNTQVVLDADSASWLLCLNNSPSCSLSGMTLQNSTGPGLYCDNSNPVLQDLTITRNHGGGLACQNSSPQLTAVTINSNENIISSSGGGISCLNSSLVLLDVFVSKNRAQTAGGGIFCNASNLFLMHVVIDSNEVVGNGGGIYAADSDPYIQETVISGNTASMQSTYGNPGYGGGMCLDNSNPYLQYVDIKMNVSDFGGGICFLGNSMPLFDPADRCNIFLNEAAGGSDLYASSSSDLIIVVDTFTVLVPTDYYAEPLGSFTFDIWNYKLAQVYADVFVSPGGDNSNSGLTPADPFRTIRHAFAVIVSDSLNQHTVHLLPGTYNPTVNGELFPLNLPDYLNMAGISDSLVFLDPGGTAAALKIQDNSCNHVSGMTVMNSSENGVYCRNSSPLLENMTVKSNYGHGIVCEENSCPIIKNTVITQNFSNGIYCVSSSGPVIQNVTVNNNGNNGIQCISSSPEISNAAVSDNLWTGIDLYDSYATLQQVNVSNNVFDGINCNSSYPLIRNTVISDNQYTGVYLNSSDPTLDTVRITNNSGGGLSCYFSAAVLKNVRITHNSSQSSGGGVSCYNSSPFFQGVTIAGNTSSEYGGGMYCNNSSPFFDSISRGSIYGNESIRGKDIYSESPLMVFLDTFTVCFPTKVYAQPLGNLTFDILHCIMQQVNADLYVSPGGADTNSGLSAADPFKTLSHAVSVIITDSLNPHTIYLMEGTYSDSVNGEKFPVDYTDYLALEGKADSLVILDAGSQSGVITIKESKSVRISGLTVTGGYADSGGGIFCAGSGVEMHDMIITGNTADNEGGGIYISSSTGAIENVKITGNAAGQQGSGYGGGGIFIFDTSPYFLNVLVSGNSSGLDGGGLYCMMASPVMKDVVMTGNTADDDGGALACRASSPLLVNVTVSGNTAGDNADGIFSFFQSHPELISCIVWGNGSEQIYYAAGAQPWVFWSDIEGGFPGNGNINANPQFLGTGRHPYALATGSPSINTGRADTMGLNLPPYDFAGNPRIWGGRVDQGAYEWNNVGTDDPEVRITDSGIRIYPEPFSGIVTVEYIIPETGMVNLKIINVLGENVTTLVNEVQAKGQHKTDWRPDGLPAGIYFCNLRIAEKMISCKIMKTE